MSIEILANFNQVEQQAVSLFSKVSEENPASATTQSTALALLIRRESLAYSQVQAMADFIATDLAAIAILQLSAGHHTNLPASKKKLITLGRVKDVASGAFEYAKLISQSNLSDQEIELCHALFHESRNNPTQIDVDATAQMLQSIQTTYPLSQLATTKMVQKLIEESQKGPEFFEFKGMEILVLMLTSPFQLELEYGNGSIIILR